MQHNQDAFVNTNISNYEEELTCNFSLSQVTNICLISTHNATHLTLFYVIVFTVFIFIKPCVVKQKVLGYYFYTFNLTTMFQTQHINFLIF